MPRYIFSSLAPFGVSASADLFLIRKKTFFEEISFRQKNCSDENARCFDLEDTKESDYG